MGHAVPRASDSLDSLRDHGGPVSCSTSCFATGRSTSCGSLHGIESGRGSTLPARGRADILPGLNPQRFLHLSLERAHFLALPFPLQSGSPATPVALQATSGTLSQVSDL